MVRRHHLVVGWLATMVLIGSLACGSLGSVVNQVVNAGKTYTNTTTLWSDVPKMDGLAPSPSDLPPTLKLLIETVIGNLGALNPTNEPHTTGSVDWIAYTTAKTPDDVSSFYTNERMVTAGWDSSSSAPCFSGDQYGFSEFGAICVFTKQSSNTQLAIIASLDSTTKQTSVFFLRVTENVTPTP
jgi:hypothetical protein